MGLSQTFQDPKLRGIETGGAYDHGLAPTSRQLGELYRGDMEGEIIANRLNGRQGDPIRANGSTYHPPESEAPEAGKGVTIGGALTLALRMPDVEYVLLPILTKGQLGTLTGHPGSCKTTLFVGISAALALDRPFGPLSPEADGLVYIVSAEDFQGTRNRIFAEAVRLRLDGDERIRLDDRLRWVHVDSNVGAATIRAEIERDAAGRDVAMIFVDTGPALFCGDDENDNVALRNFVEGFRQMADAPRQSRHRAGVAPEQGRDCRPPGAARRQRDQGHRGLLPDRVARR